MAAPDAEYRCFVGGLAWATTDDALFEAFSTHGQIIESKVRIGSDPDSTRLCRSRICYSLRSVSVTILCYSVLSVFYVTKL
ncbi:Glycine-rich RNA-binding protein 2 [Linum perenne]